jgi:hypothetical protein
MTLSICHYAKPGRRVQGGVEIYERKTGRARKSSRPGTAIGRALVARKTDRNTFYQTNCRDAATRRMPWLSGELYHLPAVRTADSPTPRDSL